MKTITFPWGVTWIAVLGTAACLFFISKAAFGIYSAAAFLSFVYWKMQLSKARREMHLNASRQ